MKGSRNYFITVSIPMEPSEVSLRVLQITLACTHCTTHHAPRWGYGTGYYVALAVMEFNSAEKTDPYTDHSKLRKDIMTELFTVCNGIWGKEGIGSSMKKGKAVLEGFPAETVPGLGFERWVGVLQSARWRRADEYFKVQKGVSKGTYVHRGNCKPFSITRVWSLQAKAEEAIRAPASENTRTVLTSLDVTQRALGSTQKAKFLQSLHCPSSVTSTEDSHESITSGSSGEVEGWGEVSTHSFSFCCHPWTNVSSAPLSDSLDWT